MNKLFSYKGVDTTMVIAPILNFPKSKYHRLPFVPLKLMISMSKSKQLIMFQCNNQIKIWRLGKGKNNKIDILKSF